ncbi:hypothetical protein HAX54_047523 [Datura stramonium]|uniref:Uncharacterized protein n=1 Tax=Datura stramonium TaxID=4076 RepID=A0ABS8WIC2_DATST|nr:hypothetical protein [Datura stramonium]
MAPKVNKGKEVASSSQGSKRERTTSEGEHEDDRITPQPLRRYGLRWITEQEDRLHTLGLNFEFNALGDCNLNMGHDIEEEEADYRPAYEPWGVDVTKTKKSEGINSPILIVNKRNARIENMLSHFMSCDAPQLQLHGQARGATLLAQGDWRRGIGVPTAKSGFLHQLGKEIYKSQAIFIKEQ